MKTNKKILWVDDDPQERFSYYIDELTDVDGWHIDWASTVIEAMSMLHSDTYEVILLDQMLPIKNKIDQIENWGGCFLLYWLRGAWENFNQTIYKPEFEKYSNYDYGIPPKPGNKDIPVILVSALNDAQLLKETEKANQRKEVIQLISKPIDINQLRLSIQGI